MLDQEGPYLGDVLLMRAERDQQRRDIGGRRVRRRAGPGVCGVPLGNDGPVQLGEEGAIAPHHGVMVAQDSQRALVTRLRGPSWQQALSRIGEWYPPLCHGAPLLPRPSIMLQPTLTAKS